MKKSTRKTVPEPDELSELLAALDLSEDTLTEAALAQPKLFAKAANLRIEAMRYRANLEGRMKSLKAETSISIRKWAEDKGEKTTEAGITARVDSDSDVMALGDQVRESQVYEEYMDLLIQAYRARANSIRVVADLKQAEVYHGQKVSHMEEMDDLRKRVNAKFPGKK